MNHTIVGLAIIAAFGLAGCFGENDPAATRNNNDDTEEQPQASNPTPQVAVPTQQPVLVQQQQVTTIKLVTERSTADLKNGGLVFRPASTGLDELIVANESVRMVIFASTKNATQLQQSLANANDMGGMVAALPVRKGDYVTYSPPTGVQTFVVFLDYNSVDKGQTQVYLYDWAAERWSETRFWEDAFAPYKGVFGGVLTFTVYDQR